MNRGSFHARSFRHFHFYALEIFELKMALRARKVSGGSRDRPRDAEIDSTLGLEKISNRDHSRNAS